MKHESRSGGIFGERNLEVRHNSLGVFFELSYVFGEAGVFTVAVRYAVRNSPYGPFLHSKYVDNINVSILLEEAFLNLNLAIKSTVAAVALAVAGYASADTTVSATPLSFAQSNIVKIKTESFTNTFSFHVDTLSRFTAYLSSPSQNIADVIQAQPLSFSSISLGSTTGVISNSSLESKGSISKTLGQGDYVLTVAGTAAPLVSSMPGVAGNYGIYTVHGSLAPIPEPESYAMFLAGLGVIGAVAHRRQSKV